MMEQAEKRHYLSQGTTDHAAVSADPYLHPRSFHKTWFAKAKYMNENRYLRVSHASTLDACSAFQWRRLQSLQLLFTRT